MQNNHRRLSTKTFTSLQLIVPPLDGSQVHFGRELTSAQRKPITIVHLFSPIPSPPTTSRHRTRYYRFRAYRVRSYAESNRPTPTHAGRISTQQSIPHTKAKQLQYNQSPHQLLDGGQAGVRLHAADEHTAGFLQVGHGGTLGQKLGVGQHLPGRGVGRYGTKR